MERFNFHLILLANVPANIQYLDRGQLPELDHGPVTGWPRIGVGREPSNDTHQLSKLYTGSSGKHIIIVYS